MQSLYTSKATGPIVSTEEVRTPVQQSRRRKCKLLPAAGESGYSAGRCVIVQGEVKTLVGRKTWPQSRSRASLVTEFTHSFQVIWIVRLEATHRNQLLNADDFVSCVSICCQASQTVQ